MTLGQRSAGLLRWWRVKLVFVEGHLRHRHQVHGEQGECETYLKLCLDGLNPEIKLVEFVREAVKESNTQLPECPLGLIALEAQPREFRSCPMSGHEILGQWWHVAICLPAKAALELTLEWNSTDVLRTVKEVGSVFQKGRETWGDAPRKLTEDEEYGPADAREGEEETENVGEFHE